MNETTKIIDPFGITWLDYPDNESLAVIVYFLGCENNCVNCHNPTFKYPDNPKARNVTIKQLYNDLFEFCKKHQTYKIIFTGGDPCSSYNIDFVRRFVSSYGNIFNICIYTGYDIAEVKKKEIKGFTYIKTGPYKEELKQESLKTDDYIQLASTNQEFYNKNYSLKSRNGRMNF